MTNGVPQLLEGVHDIRSRLVTRSLEIERARRIPPDLVSQLRSIGLFRMLVPRAFGGYAIDAPMAVDILTELAQADGATAWVVMIGCHAPLVFSMFPRSTFEAIYADGPDVIGSGSSAPRGTAERCSDGFRVSGRWSLASGCEHADWMFGVCAESPSDAASPSSEEAPRPLHFVALPAARWKVIDAWNAAGLRGTGSQDIALECQHVGIEATVPLTDGEVAQRSFNEAGFIATHLQKVLHVAAVALGIAEGALEDVTALGLTGKRRLYAGNSLAEMPVFQHRLGRVEASVRAARAYLSERVTLYWRQALSGNVELAQDIAVLQAATWIAETCVLAVDSCFRAAGAAAVYESSPLQRRLRDIHTLQQHILVDEGFYTGAGAARLGRPPGVPFVRVAAT